MKLAFTLLISIFCSYAAFSTTITTAGNGYWSSTVPNAPWPGGVMPSAGDIIIIGNGFTLTVDGDYSCSSIGFSAPASGSGSGSLIINNGFQLIVTGLFAIPATGVSVKVTGSYIVSGGGSLLCNVMNCGNTTTPSSSNNTTITLTSTLSALSVSGNLNFNATFASGGAKSNNPILNLQSGMVNVGGSITTTHSNIANFSKLDLVTSASNPTLVLSGSVPFSLSNTGTNNINLNGSGATVKYSYMGTQVVKPASYTNLTLAESGNKNTSGVTVTGKLSLQGTAAAVTASPTYGASAILEYKGSTAQTTTNIEFPTSARPNSVIIDNANGVILNGDKTINNSIIFNNGKVITNSYKLIIANSATVDGAGEDKYVQGNLQKNIGLTSGSITFDIGDASTYAPVNLQLVGVSVGGSIMASTTGSDHSQIATSNIPNNKSVNRHWVLTNTGVLLSSYDATFNFASSDLDPDITPADFVVSRYYNSSWSRPSTGTRTSSSTQALTLTQFGSFQLGEACSVPALNANLTNISCRNTNTGSIDLVLSGGSSPFTYSWTGSAFTSTTEDINNRTAGTYSVTVTANGGCTATGSYTLTQPATTLSGSVSSKSNVLCQGGSSGSVTVSGSGSVPPYSYKLDDGDYQSNGTFGGLSPGNYVVTIMDANGCTNNVSFAITEPSTEVSGSVISQNEVLCFGSYSGSVNVAGNGGTSPYTYSVNNNSFQSSGTFNGLPAGIHMITVKDANGCIYTVETEIIQPPEPLSATVSSQEPATCNGIATGSVTIEAAGGVEPYMFKRGNGNYQAASTFINLPAGAHNITVKDVNNCTFQLTATIEQPAILSASVTSESPWVCSGEVTSLSVTATGGTEPYEYELNGGGFSSEPTFEAGTDTHNLRVRDANNCLASATIIIITRPAPAVPGTISGNTDVCQFVGYTNSLVNYRIRTVPNATAYEWYVTPGMEIISGDGDTSIMVQFDNSSGGFLDGRISVVSRNECEVSTDSSNLAVVLNVPGKAGVISGPTNACYYTGVTENAAYSIRPVRNATFYEWTAPEGTSIVGHGNTTIAPVPTLETTDTLIYIRFSAQYNAGGEVTVLAKANCGYTASRSTYPIQVRTPVTPATIKGPFNVCSETGSGIPVGYSIAKVSGAVTYLWTVPPEATIMSGQGDTVITVKYNSNFISGNITVKSVANCGSSLVRTLAVAAKLPATPGNITGLSDVCNIIASGSTTVYTIRKVAGATSYTWSVPNLATIVSGQGDTTVRIRFANGFLSGRISVVAMTQCGTSPAKSLVVSVKVPGTPGTISGAVDICSQNNTNVVYSIRRLSNATSYAWSVPNFVTIVSGQGDTSVTLRFANTFVSGIIRVSAMNSCAVSSPRTLTVYKRVPAIPGAITPQNITTCPTRTIRYSVSSVPVNVTSLQWTAPAGGTIINGQGTQSIIVSYNTNAVNDTLRVEALSNCEANAEKKLKVSLPPCNSGKIAESPQITSTTHLGLPEIHIQPNPTNYQFVMVMKDYNHQGPLTIEIKDVRGGKMELIQNVKSGSRVTFGKGYPEGIYFVDIKSATSGRHTLKVVKIK
jgi:hypothetical protein